MSNSKSTYSKESNLPPSVKRDLDILSEITEFYIKYGAEIANATPDHLAVELEFMYYLIAREYDALESNNPDEAKKYKKAQQDFLEKHLLKWLDKLYECVRKKSSLRGYVELIKTIHTFIKSDYDVIKL